MFGREAQANTFLGRGIPIPHGKPQDRELIFNTGIAVVPFPVGVVWNDGKIVHLAVGIAAKAEEHLAILTGLIHVLDEGQSIEVQLMEGAGLHARPATMFVEIASRFTLEISVEHNGKTTDGKAMTSLLRVAVEGVWTILIRPIGLDADAALNALRKGVKNVLGDASAAVIEPAAPGWTPVSTGHALTGVAASPALAIGPLHHFRASRIVVRDETGEPIEQIGKLHGALQRAHAQLEDVATPWQSTPD